MTKVFNMQKIPAKRKTGGIERKRSSEPNYSKGEIL